MADKNTWAQEDKWWEQNFSSRPYASGRTYSDYRPAYQYGYESGRHHMGRNWNDVESDLRTGWDKYEGRGQSTWDHVKDAVRDAWDRVTGQHDVDARQRCDQARVALVADKHHRAARRDQCVRPADAQPGLQEVAP